MIWDRERRRDDERRVVDSGSTSANAKTLKRKQKRRRVVDRGVVDGRSSTDASTRSIGRGTN